MFQNGHSAQYRAISPYVPVCTRQVGGGDQRNGVVARAITGGGPPAFFGGLEAAKGTPQAVGQSYGYGVDSTRARERS